jgi:hypothetical protein
MGKRNVILSLIGSGIVLMAMAVVSEATGTVPRAFVSINGTDTNPCSAIEPCRSFNQALTVVQPGGEIVVQNSGGYSTGFTITQSVTIDAAGYNASVISTSARDLCIINAGPTDTVVLRGISFHGANVGGAAIIAGQVGGLYVEHCSITEFPSPGVLMSSGGNLFMTDTDIRKCSNFGIDAGTLGAADLNLVMRDSRITQCGGGIFLYSSGTGSVKAWLSNCTASLCNAGFWAHAQDVGNVEMTLTNCRAFGNLGDGINAESSSIGGVFVSIANCVVTNNLRGILQLSTGAGAALVFGTSPGTNFIANNGTDGSVTSPVPLQ